MGTTPSPKPKWQWETNAIAKLRSQDLSCYRECKQQRFYRLSQSTNAIKRLKLTFPTTYFTMENVFFFGKCREILVTAYQIINAICTNNTVLRKALPTGW